jgi:nucleotide-binding universal stress UspA family protein
MIPPRTILAAVDFSDGSREALVLAARLAHHCRAQLHILHAEDPLLRAAAEESGVDLGVETHGELQHFIASAWPAAECMPRVHASTGPAVDVILDAAGRHDADLVVVGRTGMSGGEQRLFGSTTEELLRRSNVSVLVAPKEWPPPRSEARDLSGVGPLVAAVDLSDPSVAAARAACRLAAALHCPLEVVFVVAQRFALSRWRAHAENAVRARAAAARKELEEIVLALACSVPVRMRVETGSVPRELAAAAERTTDRAPMLVLGKKIPGAAGAPPGAIAYRVLTLARAPVLMYIGE